MEYQDEPADPAEYLPAQEKTTHDYYCNHCGKVVQRKSTKTWIRSYCDAVGNFTRLWKVPDER